MRVIFLLSSSAFILICLLAAPAHPIYTLLGFLMLIAKDLFILDITQPTTRLHNIKAKRPN